MREKSKRGMALFLSLVIAGSMMFTGCGNKSDSSEEAVNANPTTAAGTTENATTEPTQDPKDLPTIKLSLITAAEPADKAMVEEAISEITREKIGCNVEIVPVMFGNMSTQMSLLLSGGDNMIDVYSAGTWSTLGGVVNNGQAIALDEYLAPYEEEIKAVIGEDVYNCGKIDNTMYGIPRYLSFAGGVMYSLKKEVADKYGLNNGDAIDLDTLTELFKKMRADYPDTALVGTSSIGLNNTPFNAPLDNLGDTNVLGALMPGDDTTVVNYYETDEYKKMLGYFKQWKDIGITMADPLNVVERPTDYLPSGKCLGMFSVHFNAKLNGEYATSAYGVEMTTVSVMDQTKSSPNWWFCVSPTCEYPQEAAGLLYLMATDPEVENLLCNGIEGVHYVLKDDGTAEYLEGKNMTNTGWSMSAAWTQLNSSLSIPFESSPDYYELMVKSNEEIMSTKAFGFQFDNTSVANEIAACTNVVSQYRAALEVGLPDDMDKTYEEFVQALKDAGIDNIIAEKQRQLDEYEASK